MSKTEDLAGSLEKAFTLILNERMAGIPILNEELKVEAVDFQEYEGRTLGIIITPWLMNLVLLPGKNDNWSGLNIGDIQSYDFPAESRDFTVNEIDDLGVLQSCALYSPMFKFVNQDHARAAARKALADLMSETDPEKRLDEKRLKQFIEDGEMPGQDDTDGSEISAGTDHNLQIKQPRNISRSDLLRGNTKSGYTKAV